MAATDAAPHPTADAPPNKTGPSTPGHEIIAAPGTEDSTSGAPDTNTKISELFAKSLRLSSVVTSKDRAEHFINEVEKLASTQTKVTPETFAWEFGEEIVQIAAQIPPNNLAQAILVRAVASLYATEEKGKDDVHVWKNLGDFGMSMREAWNLSPDIEPSEDQFTGSQWINLNSFLARLFRYQIVKWKNFPLWEFRSALETPLSDGGPSAGIRIRVVREWLSQAAPQLLQESLLNTFSDFPEGGNNGRPYRGGPLYTGKSCFSLERWCFWKRRLDEIRTDVDENLRVVVDESTGFMNQAEKELGKLVKVSAKLEFEDDDAW
ncbi:hypothetical protein F4805DRAFT_395435 [Annulohypoxylon moriforme]|nr:hypothetical protein F4805DRAFT_395435 [Annulohypoxylon moriforme]